MHLSKPFLVTFTTTVAYAQTGNATADAAMLPACVRSCFTLGVDSVGCAITDFSCHCSPAHNASIYAIAMPCTAKNCTTAETQNICRITLASNTSSSITATSAPTTTISVPSMPSSLASTSAVRMGGLSTFLLGLVAVGGMAASVGLL